MEGIGFGRVALSLTAAMVVGCGPSPTQSAVLFGTSGTGEDGASESETAATEETESGTESGSESETGEPEPFCCGCLCADDTWSCSEDTCVTEGGLAVGLEAEAGFLEIEDGTYVTQGATLNSPRHRVWYSYHPADDAPEDAPLMILFNGGPGSSTGPLFGFNTGPFTFDPDVAGEDPLVPTPQSWTSFANLLHVDAPGTGFSYVMPDSQGDTPSVGIDPDRDAAAMVRVLVRFLKRHPDLQDNAVIILGESYGGTRATLMMSQLLAYESLGDEGVDYQDPELETELTQHFAAVYPDSEGTGLDRGQVAAQFGHMVVVQGLVAGELQLSVGNAMLPPPEEIGCVDGFDIYQCDEQSGYTFDRIYQMAASLVQLDLLEQALGVDPTTIQWMYASEREGAYGRDWISGSEAAVVDPSEMIEVFGDLGQDDNYYVGFNQRVNFNIADARDTHDSAVGTLFLFDAYFSEVLLTDAIFDTVVWSPGIPAALDLYDSMVVSVQHDTDPREGFDRAGWITMQYREDVVPDSADRELRFPHYAGSGHIVTLGEPAALLEDIRDWYEGQ